MLHNDPKSQIPEIRPKSLDFGFWIGAFWIWDSGFWILGGPGGCTTRQFSDGALRSEARVPPGPSLGAVRNQPYLIRLGKGRELGGGNSRKSK